MGRHPGSLSSFYMFEIFHNDKKNFSRKGIKLFITLAQQDTPQEISQGAGGADSARMPN